MFYSFLSNLKLLRGMKVVGVRLFGLHKRNLDFFGYFSNFIFLHLLLYHIYVCIFVSMHVPTPILSTLVLKKYF